MKFLKREREGGTKGIRSKQQNRSRGQDTRQQVNVITLMFVKRREEKERGTFLEVAGRNGHFSVLFFL